MQTKCLDCACNEVHITLTMKIELLKLIRVNNMYLLFYIKILTKIN